MKNPAQSNLLVAHNRRSYLAWFVLALLAFSGDALAAITLSPSSLAMPVGATTIVKVGGTRGEVQAETKNTAVATVRLSRSSDSGTTLSVTARGAGSTTISVRDSRSSASLPVKVSTAMVVSPTSISLSVGTTAKITASNYSGTVSAASANKAIATVSLSGNVATVKGVAAGATVIVVKDSKTTVNVPVTVLSSAGAGQGKYSLVAWNDLGMHCVDGKDYSIFSILPPFNNLHAQLVNASTGKLVTAGVTLTYEAVADPTGSINTQSATKTNFWTWVKHHLWRLSRAERRAHRQSHAVARRLGDGPRPGQRLVRGDRGADHALRRLRRQELLPDGEGDRQGRRHGRGARHDDDRAAGERRDDLRRLPRLAPGHRDQPGPPRGEARGRMGERSQRRSRLEEEHPSPA